MSENLTQKRDYLMAALSAAGKIAEASPVMPDNVELRAVSGYCKPYDLVVAFHHRPEAVVEFAAAFDLPMALQDDYVNGKPHVEATGTLFGVEVRAYALGERGEQERYAACVAAVGLPSEWVAA